MTPKIRRTKRRYAHELYPHADEWEVRPLTVEVPYLLARALGFQTWGTGWFDAEPNDALARTAQYLAEGRMALLADALLQDLVGDEAWTWMEERTAGDNIGAFLWERAVHYGVNPDLIKPYACGPDPDRHAHHRSADARDMREDTYVAGREEDCEECTELVDAPEDPKQPGAYLTDHRDLTWEWEEDGHKYPFFESEDGGTFIGLGHQDPAEFVQAVADYCLHHGTLLSDPIDPASVKHLRGLAYQWADKDGELGRGDYYVHKLPVGATDLEREKSFTYTRVDI
jgi:hypothetical protein